MVASGESCSIWRIVKGTQIFTCLNVLQWVYIICRDRKFPQRAIKTLATHLLILPLKSIFSLHIQLFLVFSLKFQMEGELHPHLRFANTWIKETHLKHKLCVTASFKGVPFVFENKVNYLSEYKFHLVKSLLRGKWIIGQEPTSLCTSPYFPPGCTGINILVLKHS